ncbi:MAG: pantetheine-phosphate adenylyltransferase [Lentimicrobiaceae bacterium]|jgi:pantetheine-phosphate adenylyltransferase|nr:pantetheine-phosphate adenylyltransferase [Lentimicrobiaceae bacterium]MCP4909204.1 pantetheine-phosphate adenylyltransferase [Bacteroidota bacterium]MBT3453592.1 pantetheine-phosphate adenylyltransferase [Lentimicrobiaceae bacterium]MBT3818933.1 pantetheine-phosphate adenylyltransferase [Lentimicrobiaceae bacterium]MBT4060456.1 pantetheine-phosphate adenylyltransferase [Lentimicrobiaceae bacterium]
MERIAVFPGSFDPVTLGHVSVIRRALPLFDKIIISIGVNSEKKSMFTLEQRMNWLNDIFSKDSKVEIKSYSGLTVEFCNEVNAKFILRGLRTSADFEFERGIGQINRKLSDNIETVFFLTEAKYTPLSSSIVRDVIRNGGSADGLIPPEVIF